MDAEVYDLEDDEIFVEDGKYYVIITSNNKRITSYSITNFIKH